MLHVNDILAENIFKFSTYADQERILNALGHGHDILIGASRGIIVLRHESDHCGEDWTEVQVLDADYINL